jgi:hypothetical protein
MKTHKIRHNGKFTEFVDAHTARGIEKALEDAASVLINRRNVSAANDALDALVKANHEPAPDTEPRKRQPLEAADIPPGSVLKWPGWLDGSWEAVTRVTAVDVTLARPAKIRTYWHLAKEGYQIKRPGEGWKPCSKPGEVA